MYNAWLAIEKKKTVINDIIFQYRSCYFFETQREVSKSLICVKIDKTLLYRYILQTMFVLTLFSYLFQIRDLWYL